MNVAVDGLIYERQELGGISRIFNEVLPRVCDLNPDTSITLVTSSEIRQSLPDHPRIVPKTVPSIGNWMRPRRFWRQTPFHVRCALLSRASASSGTIWHSTYYTVLPRNSAARVVSVYDMIHENLPDLYRTRGASAFRQQKKQAILEADCLLCISHTTQRDLCQYYGIDPSITRVALLAPSPVFQLLSGSDRSSTVEAAKPFFLYVGKRQGYKNFDSLLNCFATWPRRNDVDLIAVGPPWTHAERARLSELDLCRNVYIQTNINDHALCRMYNRAVAFIYPSRYEGFGIPILEAMACGCPVIASAIPSSVEIAEGAAIFFDPNDPHALEHALDAALASDTSTQLIQAGLERAKRYSWNRTAAQTLAVYQELSSR